MALDFENVVVLSFNRNIMCVNGARDSYTFGASNGEDPSINIIPLNDLQFINSNTQVFKDGWLTFEDEFKEEIYKKLRIFNWKNILNDNDIEDILIHPTIDGLERIIKIDNPTYFDRVRFVLLNLIEQNIDITTKVKDIIDRRYKELLIKQRVSSIKLTEKAAKVNIDKTEELEKQNEALQAQLDEMKAMMEKLMSMQTTNVDDTQITESKSETNVVQQKKAVGRPSNKNK